jgi:MFS family permease
MCYTFEAVYLVRRLGLSSTVIGLVVGATMLLGLPLQIVGGAAVDRFGRRPVLAFSMVSAICLEVGLGLSTELWLVVALIAFEAACGWALFITSTNAIVADLVPVRRRDEAYSLLRVAMNAGMTLGPLAAAPLLALDPTFRLDFLAGAAIVALFLVLVLAVLRETRPAQASTRSLARSFSGYGAVLRDRRLLAFCLVALLPLYVFGQIWVAMPIMLGDLFGMTPQQWGLLLVVYGGVLTVLQYPLVRLLHGRGHLTALAVASACLGIGVALTAFVPWPATFACMAAVAAGLALLIPVSATVVAGYAPLPLRGRYMGAWTLVYMGGYALGALVGGAVLEAIGGHAAFLVAGVAGVLGGALFAVLGRRSRDDDANPSVAPGDGPAPA